LTEIQRNFKKSQQKLSKNFLEIHQRGKKLLTKTQPGKNRGWKPQLNPGRQETFWINISKPNSNRNRRFRQTWNTSWWRNTFGRYSWIRRHSRILTSQIIHHRTN
jgi:hypothetical protein